MTLCDDDGAAAASNIRLIGCDDGDVFHLLGDGAGAEGVELLEDGGFETLIEAQVKVLERTPVRMDGAILRAVKTAVMDVTLELSVNAQFVNDSFGEVDGALREAFCHELDPFNPRAAWARIVWETAGDTRWLEVALTESQSWEVRLDPHRTGWFVWSVKLRAYTPFWQADPVSRSLTFSSPGTKTIEIGNPTGVPMFHKWVGTVGQWRLPDNSWEGRRWDRAPGGRYPNRAILYPNLSALNGGLVVDYDPSRLPVRDKNDTNLIGTMPVPGSYPRFWVPPFTQPQEVSVTAVQVPSGGAAITLIQPRQYRRPWGRV